MSDARGGGVARRRMLPKNGEIGVEGLGCHEGAGGFLRSCAVGQPVFLCCPSRLLRGLLLYVKGVTYLARKAGVQVRRIAQGTNPGLVRRGDSNKTARPRTALPRRREPARQWSTASSWMWGFLPWVRTGAQPGAHGDKRIFCGCRVQVAGCPCFVQPIAL